MKMLKKLIFIFMISLLSVFVIPTKAANKDSAKDPTGVSTYTPTNSVTKDIYGMNHTLAEAKTSTKGNNKGQLINVFEMKTDGVTSKLVTWAVQKEILHIKELLLLKLRKIMKKNILVGLLQVELMLTNISLNSVMI